MVYKNKGKNFFSISNLLYTLEKKSRIHPVIQSHIMIASFIKVMDFQYEDIKKNVRVPQ